MKLTLEPIRSTALSVEQLRRQNRKRKQRKKALRLGNQSKRASKDVDSCYALMRVDKGYKVNSNDWN